jgi:sialic acid synthase SpsE
MNKRDRKKKKIYILAEMAASHDGSEEKAEVIIEAASKAGADGILFQIYDVDTYVIPSDDDYQSIQKYRFDKTVWEKLIKKAILLGLEVWANVYDLASLDICRNLQIKGYKLHSSNLENEKLVTEVVKQRKDIHLSIGGMRKDEIKDVVALIYSVSPDARIHLMYGLQNFPTNPEGINLNFITDLAKELKVPFGYQDHSDPMSPSSTFLPVLAVALGASVIEKHITHDRKLKGLDFQAALNPDEFTSFVKDLRLVKRIIDKDAESVSEDELAYRQYKTLMKVVARTDIHAGDIFSEDNLTVMRSKKGEIGGKKLKYLLNKKSKVEYGQYEPIKEKELL